jgi:hypothetical protein
VTRLLVNKNLPVMVKVSLAVAVYVLVPWVKVVDSGLKDQSLFEAEG